jgi:hypothetical protein
MTKQNIKKEIESILEERRMENGEKMPELLWSAGDTFGFIGKKLFHVVLFLMILTIFSVAIFVLHLFSPYLVGLIYRMIMILLFWAIVSYSLSFIFLFLAFLKRKQINSQGGIQNGKNNNHAATTRNMGQVNNHRRRKSA